MNKVFGFIMNYFIFVMYLFLINEYPKFKNLQLLDFEDVAYISSLEYLNCNCTLVLFLLIC